MNQSTYRILLDIHNDSSQVSLSAKKGDTIRAIYATLTERGNPYNIGLDCTAVFTAKKPDGNILYNNCVIEGNVIKYDVSPQTTSAIGKVECEFRLYGVDNELITSPRFSIIVSNTVYSDEDVIESTSEASALTALVAEANEVINTIETKYLSGEFNGKDGVDGKDGTDGIPCTHSWNGTTLTVTSASGTSSANLKGEKGDTGNTGNDGVSPSITVTNITNGHRVSITDATGTKTFDVTNGKDGTGATVTVDSALSDTSTNPVQNKVIKAALDGKSDFSGSYNDLTNKPNLGTLASKNTVSKTDLDSSVQASLSKADTALQSYTESDPTVPSWAKQSNKPTYTSDEINYASDTTKTVSEKISDLDSIVSVLNNSKQDKITSIGLLKGDGTGTVSKATSNTDYQEPITTSGILKGNGNGIVSAASAGTDYVSPAGSYINPTSINGTDLNDCITPGYYATVGTTDTSTNNPFGERGFLLEVIKRNDTIMQRATAYNGYYIAIRYMSISSGSWTTWSYQQDRITAEGILKGNGAGYIVEAIAGTDYLGPVTTGTWTPSLKGSTTAGSWAYSARQGKYFKAGRLVHFTMNVNAYQASSAGKGELYCSLPFTPDSSVTSGNFAGSIGFASGGASNYMRRAAYFQIQSSGCTWRISTTNNSGVYASNVVDIGTGSSNAINIQCSGWYWTA